MTQKSLGERIKELREQHGWTQNDLAAKSGKSVPTIQRAENGSRMSSETLCSIASAFGINVRDLSVQTDDMMPARAESPYLPIPEIASGKGLALLLAAADELDFDLDDIDDDQLIEKVGSFYEFCRANLEVGIPEHPVERAHLFKEMSHWLTNLQDAQLVACGDIFSETIHDVIDEGDGMPMLLASHSHSCLAIRVGSNKLPPTRAYFSSDRLEGYRSLDPRVVYPSNGSDGFGSDDSIPF